MVNVYQAIESGVGYLLKRQFADGHWEDYQLPVGRSDAWITSYVGLSLIGLARLSLHIDAGRAAARAASWLDQHRPYPSGWGYNATTGPDADSTGYALRLLGDTGHPLTPSDERWLLARWQPGGGFSTYAGPDGWGVAHPDVTPVAFFALSPDARRQLAPNLVRYLVASRDNDGTWPSYWWRTRHYSTYLNNRLARRLGLDLAVQPPAVNMEDNRAVHSAFDLVFVTANAFLYDNESPFCDALAAELLSAQSDDGSWQGAKNLRVTRHDAQYPWDNPAGERYADNEHLITTASAVGVLTEIYVQRGKNA